MVHIGPNMRMIKIGGFENRTFLDNYVNNMVADALAAYIARSSVTMGSDKQEKEILVSYKEGFRVYAPFQCWEQ